MAGHVMPTMIIHRTHSLMKEATLSSSRLYKGIFKIHHIVGKWLSLVEHSVRDAGVGGSNPLFPTIFVEGF